MNAMVRSSEVSGYFKKINGATVFYYFMHDIETALIKGINDIYALEEIGQRSMNIVHNDDYTTLNATANEWMPMQCDKSGGNTEGNYKINEGWRKPTKFVPITCFHQNQNNKRKNNDNNKVNNNRCNVLSDNVETEMNNEEDSAQIMTKEEINTMKDNAVKNKKRVTF